MTIFKILNMKKIVFLFLTALTMTVSAQTINLAANNWYVTFSPDLKYAFLSPNQVTQGYEERKFSFDAANSTMIEAGISNSPLAKFTWIYKIGSNPNNFILNQKDLQWVFDFVQVKNNKNVYKISLKYNNDNQNSQLFTDPAIKNRYYKLSTSTNLMVGYTLTKTGAFYYRGPIGEGDNDATITKGLYVMVDKQLYCLALLKNDDNWGFYSYGRRVSFDGNIKIARLGNIQTQYSIYNER